MTIQGEWAQWNNKVPKIEVETHKVGSPDIVVPTLDTVRHESLLYTWLAEHKPMVLCGPPGSGKTMTLFSALRALPDFEVQYVVGIGIFKHVPLCTCICHFWREISSPIPALFSTLHLQSSLVISVPFFQTFKSICH